MKLSRILILAILLLSNISVFGDKLAHLRTARKIITVNEIKAPYYTIQIVALQLPPGNPDFFKNVDTIREFACTDGFVRYTVGEYTTFGEAARELDRIRQMGYADAFVLNTRKITLRTNDYSKPAGDFVPVPGVSYTIQLAAFRFPVYVSHFEGFDNVQEYFMKDRIYRYCVGSFQGEAALNELSRVKQSGYPDAFLVPLNQYLPYKIE